MSIAEPNTLDALRVLDPRIVVHKRSRQLELYSEGRVVRVYNVRLGLNPEDKEIEGDHRTPEGEFYVFVKNPESKYHLSLGLSYPNIEDAERGLSQKLISESEYDAIVRAIQSQTGPPQNTSLGGLIYIHGEGESKEWTRGCVALENADIEELYHVVTLGTPVSIKR